MMAQHIVTDTVFVARLHTPSGNDAEAGPSPRTGDETLVGFVTFGREPERFRQDCTRGLVHNIYVREGNRQRGIGTLLLSVAETALDNRGVDAIGLQAMAANGQARRFYREHGYAPHRIEFEKSTESDSLTTDDE
jgi:ribosomal protein S18 acetylase RimI-like enzyme